MLSKTQGKSCRNSSNSRVSRLSSVAVTAITAQTHVSHRHSLIRNQSRSRRHIFWNHRFYTCACASHLSWPCAQPSPGRATVSSRMTVSSRSRGIWCTAGCATPPQSSWSLTKASMRLERRRKRQCQQQRRTLTRLVLTLRGVLTPRKRRRTASTRWRPARPHG